MFFGDGQRGWPLPACPGAAFLLTASLLAQGCGPTTTPEPTASESPAPSLTPGPTPSRTPTQTEDTAPPTPTPTASTSPPSPSPTTPPPAPGVPDCRVPIGDVGGFRYSLDGGKTLSRNGTSLEGIAYTWDLNIDPRDPSVILELHQGVLYRSENSGCTFSRAAMRTLDYDHMVRSEADPDLLVLTSVWSTTLAVSTDGGRTFAEDSAPTEPYELAIDPQDPDRWTVVGRAGALYHRAGLGSKWEERQMPLEPNTSVIAAAYAPTQPSLWLVATSRGVLRSEDNGLSWAVANGGLPTQVGEASEDVLSLVASSVTFAPNDASVAYLVVNVVGLVAAERGIWRSDDGGLSWQRRVVDDQPLGDVIVNVTGSTRVFVDPLQPDHALFAFGIYIDNYGTDLFRSNDGLQTLQHSNFKGFDELFALEFGPEGTDVIYVGASSEVPNGLL